MPWESFQVKLEAVDSLIGTEVEEGGLWINVPLGGIDHPGAIIIGDVVGHDVDIAVLRHFIEVLVRPHSGDEEVSFPGWLQSGEIFDDCCVLHGGASLLEENPVVVWDVEELPDFGFGAG